MIPVAFEYERADSAEAALALLAEHGDDAKLLAGGHSLIPLMKFRLAAPAVLVDIGRLSDLSYVVDDGDRLRIGALTRHRDVETNELVRQHLPLLAEATSYVGDPQVRHRGTIGGSLAHGDPAADLPSVLLALNGSVVVRNGSGEREIAADDFFTGFLETALEPTDLLTEIRLPKAPSGSAFQKFNRRAQDWAIVGCSVVAHGDQIGIGLVNMDSLSGSGGRRRGRAPQWCLRGRSGRARRRRPGAAVGPQRQRRIPPTSGPRARASGARSGRTLTDR